MCTSSSLTLTAFYVEPEPSKSEEIDGPVPSPSDHFSQVCNPEMDGSATMSPLLLPEKESNMRNQARVAIGQAEE
ncbi:uncharacterized protein N7487_007460 [Penicillium crustosum]|uniref:uncharacterized protein n=1 Tax=Penicillium crustosum TaxID=36656 RepID=UPI0023A06B6D|nr:uncharacterized protein N7487_007460 [Penicillium crustosum]KAJ5401564.1 hypothetical protein N7487_007460 [Penicillium crustosum]